MIWKRKRMNLRWKFSFLFVLSLWQVQVLNLKREMFIISKDMLKFFKRAAFQFRFSSRERFWSLVRKSDGEIAKSFTLLKIFIFSGMHKTQCNFLANTEKFKLSERNSLFLFNWKQFRPNFIMIRWMLYFYLFSIFYLFWPECSSICVYMPGCRTLGNLTL